jgi:hypothetical protein
VLFEKRIHLCKFREVNINNLFALANNKLWFSSLNDFNEPFEGSHIKGNNIDSELLSGFKLKFRDDVGDHQYQ